MRAKRDAARAPGEAETRFPGPIASYATRRKRAAVEATREMTSARTRRRVGSREVDVSSRCRGRRIEGFRVAVGERLAARREKKTRHADRHSCFWSVR